MLVSLAIIVVGGFSFAGSPPGSSTPDCIRLSPDGNMLLPVVVRDQMGDPIPYTEVRVVFEAECDAALYWCPEQEHPIVHGRTNVNGEVTFSIRAGGCYEGGLNTISIRADPADIWLAVYEEVGSPDMHSDEPPRHGDGDVDLNDFVVFSSRFLTTDTCADLHHSGSPWWTCDEDVDLDDFVVFMEKFLTDCAQ